MRKYLLPQGNRFYKVNLHSHTIYSDGKQTPEEVKDIFVKKGYSAVAFTEHEMMYDFSYLSDENFIAITAYEYGFDFGPNVMAGFDDGIFRSTDHYEKVHLNLFSKDPHDTRMVCFNPKNVWGNGKKYLDGAKYVGTPDYIRSFSTDIMNEVIRAARERDMLVIYNHPSWSMNTFNTYSKLEGLNGFEINNGDANFDSDMDYAPHVYQELARLGKRMICVGGDDNHCERACGLAWTMISAESLTYKNLIDGLEQGNSYVSDGPEITELYIEDDTVKISCSDAIGIYLYTAGRRIAKSIIGENGIPLNGATFKLNNDDSMFRITVKDKNGHHANTRYYYFDELNYPDNVQ